MQDLHPTARVEPPRQGPPGQKAAETDVSIDAKLGLPMGRQEIQPVPEGWKPIALAGQGVVAIQRPRRRGGRAGRDAVVASFRTPDPSAQVLEIDAHDLN